MKNAEVKDCSETSAASQQVPRYRSVAKPILASPHAMTSFQPWKRLPPSVQKLLRPWLAVSLALHGGVLLLPLLPEKSPEADVVMSFPITQVPAAPAPVAPPAVPKATPAPVVLNARPPALPRQAAKPLPARLPQRPQAPPSLRPPVAQPAQPVAASPSSPQPPVATVSPSPAIAPPSPTAPAATATPESSAPAPAGAITPQSSAPTAGATPPQTAPSPVATLPSQAQPAQSPAPSAAPTSLIADAIAASAARTGLQSGCGAASGAGATSDADSCWQTTNTQIQNVTRDLEAEFRSRGYAISLEDQDTGYRILRLQKVGEPLQFLNILVTDQSTRTMLRDRAMTFEEMQDAAQRG